MVHGKMKKNYPDKLNNCKHSLTASKKGWSQIRYRGGDEYGMGWLQIRHAADLDFIQNIDL